jgi:hypothetical protein
VNEFIIKVKSKSEFRIGEMFKFMHGLREDYEVEFSAINHDKDIDYSVRVLGPDDNLEFVILDRKESKMTDKYTIDEIKELLLSTKDGQVIISNTNNYASIDIPVIMNLINQAYEQGKIDYFNATTVQHNELDENYQWLQLEFDSLTKENENLKSDIHHKNDHIKYLEDQQRNDFLLEEEKEKLKEAINVFKITVKGIIK